MANNLCVDERLETKDNIWTALGQIRRISLKTIQIKSIKLFQAVQIYCPLNELGSNKL